MVTHKAGAFPLYEYCNMTPRKAKLSHISLICLVLFLYSFSICRIHLWWPKKLNISFVKHEDFRPELLYTYSFVSSGVRNMNNSYPNYIEKPSIMPVTNITKDINKTTMTCDVDDRYIGWEALGRLGNIMFQYAAIYSLAKDTGKIPTILVTDGYLDGKIFSHYFKLSHREMLKLPITCDYKDSASTRSKSGVKKFDLPAYNTLLVDKLVILSPLTAMPSQMTDIWYSYPFTLEERTCSNGIEITKDITGLAYMKKAINYFRRYFGKDNKSHKSSKHHFAFIACSDDLEWSRQNLGNIDNIYFCPGSSPIDDLAILASCNHTILTQGTYGWWGAYLRDLGNGGGLTICPSNFLKNSSNEFHRNFSYDIYYPQNWKGLPI
ncbi:uncharacterized protein LOC135928871 [Gordionus sp. m RMFG-2023]|uniref:uncharacterized protein LOC135928871 n=1 Tax=Gordionus sp. m RMFG-2023 TaxID=3053472 RepID=UPI0031FCF6A9